jgi:hypothetical protein
MRHSFRLVLCLFFIVITNYCYFVFFIKDNNHLLHLYDDRSHLNLIHFEALYPSLSRENHEEEELLLKKQKAIGVCVNFNFDPDSDGNTLGSILSFYTKINKYVVILTPSSFNKFADRNVELFYQYNVTSTLIDNRTTNTVYHIECADGRSGQFRGPTGIYLFGIYLL